MRARRKGSSGSKSRCQAPGAMLQPAICPSATALSQARRRRDRTVPVANNAMPASAANVAPKRNQSGNGMAAQGTATVGISGIGCDRCYRAVRKPRGIQYHLWVG